MNTTSRTSSKIGRAAALATLLFVVASATRGEMGTEDVKALGDLQNKERALKVHIADLEAESQNKERALKVHIADLEAESTTLLKQVQRAEPTSETHRDEGSEEAADNLPASPSNQQETFISMPSLQDQILVEEAYDPDDPLHFNPAQSDPASPLSNDTSHCREWYISDGPVKYGSNKAAADALKSAADGTWRKGTKGRSGSPPTVSAMATDGTAWGVGYKHGCTNVTSAGGHIFTICGCYEIWCPVRDYVLSHPDDVYGRDALGVDGSMAVRTTCYSARAVFGCYKSNNSPTWLDNCGIQQGGSYQPGAGTKWGLQMKSWEQLVL